MADYVVTRKRKRYAVDPSLGYYYAPPSDGGGEATIGACSNLADEQLPPECIESRLQLGAIESAPLPNESYKSGTSMRGNTNRPTQGGQRNQAQLQEENVVTVEAFLKNSTRTYRRRKLLKRQVNLNGRRSSADAEDIRSGKMDSISRRSSTSLGPHRGDDPKNKRQRKNRKPLKERLYEAAILTHGEPDDYYTRSEAAERMTQNCAALLFVPYEHASRDRAAGTTHTKACIVDPRKSIAMETASLTCRSLRGYTDSGLLSHTLDRIPLSKWNLTLDNGGHVKSAPKRKESKMTGDMASMAFAYPPLKFVSFQEAEKNYKDMFPGVGSGHFLKPHTLANMASTSPAPEGVIHKAAHDCSGQSRSSAAAPGIPLTTTTSLQTSVASPNSMNNVDFEEPPGQPPAALPQIVVSGEPSVSSHTKEQSLTTLHMDRPPSLESTLCSQIPGSENYIMGSKKNPYKPLRLLGTFVNELLTIQRNSKI